MFVAGAFQDVQSPMVKKTRPCMNAVDGSYGNTRSKIPAKGMLEPALICDSIILPELGKRLARISPILPPNRLPNEPPITKMFRRDAVCL